ncbi:hypothetical protein BaRGS_00006986 [Batillaria attramentaria]|uniref:Uncharacterized protein n=1 Tax=Batillaria attramentaria TaxID=370345 RepID=A0ABD0LRK4_9CAEN
MNNFVSSVLVTEVRTHLQTLSHYDWRSRTDQMDTCCALPEGGREKRTAREGACMSRAGHNKVTFRASVQPGGQDGGVEDEGSVISRLGTGQRDRQWTITCRSWTMTNWFE